MALTLICSVPRLLSYFQYFLENHTIHLVKIFEGRISTTYCDVGVNSKINRVAADFSHNSIIYALTEANEIIVIEQKNNNQVKGDAIECKTLGRLYLPTETPNLYTFASVKHGLLLLNRPSGELYLLDTSDLATLLQSPQLVLIYRFPPHQVPNDLRALDIKEVRANAGNLIAMNTKSQYTFISILIENTHHIFVKLSEIFTKSNDGTNETVLILEYLPSLKTQAAVEAAQTGSGWDWANFKMPVVVLVGLGFVGYIIWNKQQAIKKSKVSFGGGVGSKLTSKGGGMGKSILKKK